MAKILTSVQFDKEEWIKFLAKCKREKTFGTTKLNDFIKQENSKK